MGSAADWTARLASYGNAFLSGRYDAGRATNDAISHQVRRWRFDTLVERRYGILPLRIVASSVRGWFRWLRRNGYRRLVLIYLSPAETAALDGPLKVLTEARAGWFVVADGRDHLMLWDEWRSGPLGMFRTGVFSVEMRGAVVYPLPPPPGADFDAVAARLDAALAAALARCPEDAPAFERARAALQAHDPEAVARGEGLPVLAPAEHPLGARRLGAAVRIVWANERPHSNWLEPPPRPPEFGPALRDAILAAVNGS